MCLSAVMVPTIRVYTTDVRKRIAVHNSGKGAKYTRARLPVKLIYAQGLPVRKKPCRQKPFSSVRRGHRRKDFYLKIKIEIYLVILTIVRSPLTPLTFVKKRKKCYNKENKQNEVLSCLRF